MWLITDEWQTDLYDIRTHKLLPAWWRKESTGISWNYSVSILESLAYQADSSWNVMAHGDTREGKWRGNRRMDWVASTFHTTSEHGVSSITTADAHNSAANSWLNWRPPADLNGLANGLGSQYSSHYLGTWCIQHYYRWCAHLGCQQSTELTPPPI